MQRYFRGKCINDGVFFRPRKVSKGQIVIKSSFIFVSM